MRTLLSVLLAKAQGQHICTLRQLIAPNSPTILDESASVDNILNVRFTCAFTGTHKTHCAKSWAYRVTTASRPTIKSIKQTRYVFHHKYFRSKQAHAKINIRLTDSSDVLHDVITHVSDVKHGSERRVHVLIALCVVDVRLVRERVVVSEGGEKHLDTNQEVLSTQQKTTWLGDCSLLCTQNEVHSL